MSGTGRGNVFGWSASTLLYLFLFILWTGLCVAHTKCTYWWASPYKKKDKEVSERTNLLWLGRHSHRTRERKGTYCRPSHKFVNAHNFLFNIFFYSGAALTKKSKRKGTYAAPEREKDRKRKLLALDAFILISCRSKYLYFIFLISELRQDIREWKA